MKTSVRYVLKGRMPPAFVAVFILLAVNFCAGFALEDWDWVPVRDAVHNYGIRFRGGQWRYFQPAVGWYVEHTIGLHFALMAVAAFVLWRHRDQLQKVERQPPSSGPAGRWEWVWLVTVVPAAYSVVGGFAISILQREADWTAALATGLVFLAISLTTVFLAARQLARRSPPPLEWTVVLGLAAAVTLGALALVAVLFDRYG